MTRPPIVGAPVWEAVMTAAGDRCQCQGACGKKHTDPQTKKPGRCTLVNGQRTSKRGVVTLLATPRDPVNEGDFHIAAALPATRLIAFCPDCYDGVRRIIKRAVKQLPPQSDGLFAAEEYRVDPASKKQADVGAA
ncbi:hypothetical protein [Streptomyces sp. NPDC091383]|uniref:hypothetical protein n=1 Tax=Streptomyces sp. NPDC091383 TaxID=3365996 RepID=UPI00381DC3E2